MADFSESDTLTRVCITFYITKCPGIPSVVRQNVCGLIDTKTTLLEFCEKFLEPILLTNQKKNVTINRVFCTKINKEEEIIAEREYFEKTPLINLISSMYGPSVNVSIFGDLKQKNNKKLSMWAPEEPIKNELNICYFPIRSTFNYNAHQVPADHSGVGRTGSSRQSPNQEPSRGLKRHRPQV